MLQATLLHDHLSQLLDNLPHNIPPIDKPTLLDDLTHLLTNPIFLSVLKPRFTLPSPSSATHPDLDHHCTTSYLPPLPLSINALSINVSRDSSPVSSSNNANPNPNPNSNTAINTNIPSWTTQLCYSNTMLLEGRQLWVTPHQGFEQSFVWFGEEARGLRGEFEARVAGKESIDRVFDGLEVWVLGRGGANGEEGVVSRNGDDVGERGEVGGKEDGKRRGRGKKRRDGGRVEKEKKEKEKGRLTIKLRFWMSYADE